jgi:hypothetical protein
MDNLSGRFFGPVAKLIDIAPEEKRASNDES